MEESGMENLCFFFQAEDGIRDIGVTGVQTCALPISKDFGTGSHSQRVQRYAVELARAIEPALLADASVEYGFLLHDVGKIGIPDHVLRSEERRVGKECRSRWSPYH